MWTETLKEIGQEVVVRVENGLDRAQTFTQKLREPAMIAGEIVILPLSIGRAWHERLYDKFGWMSLPISTLPITIPLAAGVVGGYVSENPATGIVVGLGFYGAELLGAIDGLADA